MKKRFARRIQNLKFKLAKFKRDIFSWIQATWKFLPNWLGYAMLLVAVTGIAAFITFQSNLFLVTKVENSELLYTDQTAVQKILKQYIGEKIFIVSPKEIASKIEKADPYIKSVLVEKYLPGTLSAKIDERDPESVLIEIDTNKAVIIDDEYVALEIYDSIEESQYTEIAQVYIDPVCRVEFPTKRGTTFNPKGMSFIFNLKYWADKKSSASNKILKKFTLKGETAEMLTTTDTRILFDINQDWQTQINRYEVIEQDAVLKGRKLSFVDVSLTRPYGEYK